MSSKPKQNDRFANVAISFAIILAMLFSGSIAIGNSAVAGGFSTFSTPQNIGPNINSADMEQSPAPAPNGLSLYFTTNKTAPGSQGGNDIWVSQRAISVGAWGPAVNLGTTINTSSNETVSNISADGLKMFLTSNRPGSSGPDIYMSTRTDPNNDFSWTTPVNLGPVINSAGQDVGGVYYMEGSTGQESLFFWSDRAETGLGNIYQAYSNLDGTYNPPVLVNELNSPASERGIAISRDGLTIYISSNRLGPATEFRIFVSTRATISSPWNTPVPLPDLNGGSTSTPSLSPDETVIYLSSNRTGTLGLGDIYFASRISVNSGAVADFDGDGRSDLSIFRPGDGTWHVLQSGTNTYRVQPFGLSTDKIVPGDYDGDGRCDSAVFRPSTGDWYVLRSSDGIASRSNWGISTDKPVPADYDGDGRTDIAVYRNGTWYIQGQSLLQQFGLSSDIPVAGANQ